MHESQEAEAVVVDIGVAVWYADGTLVVLTDDVEVVCLSEGAWVVDRRSLVASIPYPRWRREAPLVDVQVTGGRRVPARDPLQALTTGQLINMSEWERTVAIEATSPVGYAAYWAACGARVGRKLRGELVWSSS